MMTDERFEYIKTSAAKHPTSGYQLLTRECVAEITRLRKVIAGELRDNDAVGLEFTYVSVLKEKLREIEAHLDAFCPCPSHGPSLIEGLEGEIE
jgi:hypothetical protein